MWMAANVASVMVLSGFVLACGSSDGTPGAGSPAIEIAPLSGPGGTWVDVRARGLPADDSVALGLGPPRSEYEVVRGARTGPTGRVDALMQVPDWADEGERYVFVVATVGDPPDRRSRAVSEPFIIDGAGDGRGGTASVTGVLTGAGVECPTLETAGGTVYSLAGSLAGFGQGERVTVFGTPAEASFCMQGVTLEVDSVVGAGGR